MIHEMRGHTRDIITCIVFVVCYSGMILGRFPRLRLDRTGIALLCALTLIASRVISEEQALRSLDFPTLALLFGLMVLSVQLRLGGFYAYLTLHLSRLPLDPSLMLFAMMFVLGLLSAVFSNDVICLAVAPVIIGICRERGLTPLPYLLGLACAANIGSALTLIGNPQNMLIAQTLHLSFAGYIVNVFPTVILGLFVAWLIIARQWRGHWLTEPTESASPALPSDTSFDHRQTTKGLAVALVLMVLFVGNWWPRELVTLAAAGFLLMSRHLRSSDILRNVDWQLLALFISLFVINRAFYDTGIPPRMLSEAAHWGIDIRHPETLLLVSTVLSNIVSNVPAVMLLLPWASHPEAGTLLAVSSTLAGNLFIGGSIANIIVVEHAARAGIPISWKQHAKVGVPVTFITLILAEIATRLRGLVTS